MAEGTLDPKMQEKLAQEIQKQLAKLNQMKKNVKDLDENLQKATKVVETKTK